VRIPDGYRCAVSFTFDTDMAAGYSPLDKPNPYGGSHGRTAPFVADTMRRMMDVAEEFGVRLHWFKICNGLEDGCDWSVYEEALARGHDVDCHTYNHCNVASTSSEELREDLPRANALLKKRLGIDPFVLRGPGGYREGALGAANRQIILDNGFKYVSGEVNAWGGLDDDPMQYATEPREYPVHQYPEGLIEIPVHGMTDRTWFDNMQPKRHLLQEWRKTGGHQPVPEDWQCPWTEPNATHRFIEAHKAVFDLAYEERLFADFTCHPYSFYLHDRQNIILRELFTHLRAKPEKVWIGTLRDVAGLIERPA
jgi:hypothetical protein